MPIQHALYRFDQGLKKLSSAALEKEEILEDMIAQDLSILDERWMLIGRQVHTDFGKFIDLLAIDEAGTLVLIELKRHLTPREVVAQVLDYAAWIDALEADRIAEIWRAYVEGFRKDLTSQSLDEAFNCRFGQPLAEVDINAAHQMVIVAARLDDSTERIVTYLADRGIPLNAVFFEVFADDAHRFLSRVWFRDPAEGLDPIANPPKQSGPWNGEYYVSFGESGERLWNDAMKFGFISAGGGRWYSKTLSLLDKGDRIWVNIPGKGYVGVAEVLAPVVKVDEFKVVLPDGREMPINDPAVGVQAPNMFAKQFNDDEAEYVVKVQWVKTIPSEQAVKEVGFFGNQNSVCRPTAAKWNHTVDRLKQVWCIS